MYIRRYVYIILYSEHTVCFTYILMVYTQILHVEMYVCIQLFFTIKSESTLTAVPFEVNEKTSPHWDTVNSH